MGCGQMLTVESSSTRVPLWIGTRSFAAAKHVSNSVSTCIGVGMEEVRRYGRRCSQFGVRGHEGRMACKAKEVKNLQI